MSVSPTATDAPSMWTRLVGQDHAVRLLQAAVERGATGRAYLFAGPRGVGREPAARAFAASILCVQDGCGACSSCMRVLRDAHTDVTRVEPEGSQILVEQVREVRKLAWLSPMEGRAKVIVIGEADTMNPAASNALLKVLEEPPRDTTFILITERPEDLLETVISRCARVEFQPLTPATIRAILTEQHDASVANAAWAARAGGDLATALRFVKDPTARERRRRHLEIPGRIARGGLPAVVSEARTLLAEASDASVALRDEQDEEVAQLAELLGERRGSAAPRKRLEGKHKRELRARELLALDSALRDLASFYRDCLVVAAGGDDETLTDVEERGRFDRAARAVEPAWLAAAVASVERARRMLARNTNAQLTLEALFAKLAVPRPKR